ncbi:hypothetical protein [Streptomyces sp. NPDC050504]|uniref:hypothetical protein n=1 Tax=Streptomyces sp. NPDC050504 TaxID=3365618 RepID=UPI0037B10CEC
MSFGDPNNPYGQPPQGQQPSYGYPQQPQPQQPGYGYPQAPPIDPYGMGGGFPGGPVTMPGGVKAARVMIWVISGLQIIAALLMFALASQVDKLDDDGSEDVQAILDLGKGGITFVGVLSLVFAGLGIALALKFAKGGNATRTCAIVYGSFIVLFAVFQLPLGIVSLVLGILIIVFCAKRDGGAWFNRPRHQQY